MLVEGGQFLCDDGFVYAAHAVHAFCEVVQQWLRCGCIHHNPHIYPKIIYIVVCCVTTLPLLVKSYCLLGLEALPLALPA